MATAQLQRSVKLKVKPHAGGQEKTRNQELLSAVR